MAQKRMFDKNIVESDAFYSLPMGAQVLYIHLSMNADDDGVVNNPFMIQRACGASQGDAEALVSKKFVICFDSGIVVLKHWLINNYIRKDYKKKSAYKDELGKLFIKSNGSYTLDSASGQPLFNDCSTDAQQSVQQLFNDCSTDAQQSLTQSSLDKNSIENRIDKNRLDKPNLSKSSLSERLTDGQYNKLMALFGENLPGILAEVDSKVDDPRKIMSPVQYITACGKEYLNEQRKE